MQSARTYQLNPFFVAAVIRVESHFRPQARSDRGALGLMQLMPSTAQWIYAKQGHRRILPVHALYRPAVNIPLGTWYLRYLLQRYHGNEVLALAAYNGGPHTVNTWLAKGYLHAASDRYEQVPYRQTKNFIARVLFFKAWYRHLYGWWPKFHTKQGGESS
ncbi:MAG: lytic transglycosylase domain-containing protein [Firmicutes bacterium]|nr:lytic transglycosylase domain-containing protein [Bacillota bacterium]